MEILTLMEEEGVVVVEDEMNLRLAVPGWSYARGTSSEVGTGRCTEEADSCVNSGKVAGWAEVRCDDA